VILQAFDFVLGGRRSDGSLNGVARGDGGLAGGFLPVVFAARVDDGAAGVDHHAGAFGGLAGLNAGADVAALSADPDALAAQLREALLAEDAPAPQSVGEAEALARTGPRRALAGLTRALTERGGLPPEWTEPLCAVPAAVAAALGIACAAEL